MGLLFGNQMGMPWGRNLRLGARYYFSQAGSDANDGLSISTPKKSMTALAGLTLSPGDQVVLRRGDVWRESLSLTQGGSAGKPLTLSDYGVGDLPRITGADAISGWSQHNASGLGSDLLTNGGFESWTGGAPDNWVVTGTVTQDTSAPEAGVSDAVMDNSGGTAKLQQSIALVSGTTYQFSFWHKESAASYQMAWQIYDSVANQCVQPDGSWGANTTVQVANATAWTKVTIQFTAQNNNTIRFQLGTYTGGTYTSSVDAAAVQAVTVGGAVANVYDAALASTPGIVTLNGSRLALGSGADTLTSGEYYYSGGTLSVYDANGNPDTAADLVEYPARDNPFIWNVSGATNTGDITLQNVAVSHATNRAFRPMNVTGLVKILGCDFYGAADGGAAGNPGTLAPNNCSGGGFVSGCDFHDTDNDGAYLWNSPSWEFDACTFTRIYGTTSDGIQFYGDATGDYSTGYWVHTCSFDMSGTNSPKGGIAAVSGSTASRVEYNTFTGGNYACGITHSNVTISHNYMSDMTTETWSSGILIGGAVDADNYTVYANTIVNTSIGIYSSGSNARTNFTIQHNTLVDYARHGIVFEQATDGAIQDNILDGPSASNRHLTIPSVTAGQTLTVGHNLYDHEFTGCISYAGTAYDTLAAFQSGTGQGAGSVVGDPLFTNPSANDYTLQAGSPALNAASDGTNIGAL